MKNLHIFYILDGFPRISEMSTLNFIIAMIKRNVRVTIVSFKDMKHQKVMHDFVKEYDFQKKTIYLGHRSDLPNFSTYIKGVIALIATKGMPLSSKLQIFLYFSRKKRTFLYYLLEIVNRIKKANPDIIFCHFGNVAENAILLKSLFDIPFVTFFHGYDFSRLPNEGEVDYTELFRYGDWFFANSNFGKYKLIELGCPDNKLSVPGLPIDESKYPFKARKPDDTIHLLTVARLTEKKGLLYSISAVANCVRKISNINYTIIGDGELKDELKDLIENLGVQDKIHLIGEKKHEEVIEYMLSSHLFILSSITAENGDTEGLGMVLLEAQLTGMPVIATLHNGFVDSVNNTRSGLLVPEKDVESLTDKLMYLIENPQLWPEMGTEGRKHVIEKYSENKVVDIVLNKLTELVR